MDAARYHLNLIESSRQLFELDPGAAVEAEEGWLLGAGGTSHPVISNAAFRSDDDVDAEGLLRRAKDFFGSRRRGFSLWVRGDVPEDADLEATAEAAGMQCVYSTPEMVLAEPVEERPLPEGAEVRRISSESEVDEYWQIAASSYESLGFPPEVFGSYTDRGGLLADNVAAFITYLNSEPASIAMTIVSHGVAGIYWVGSLERARGRGLGRATTAAATNAGFALGAGVASLQASEMGQPIYAEMGYEALWDYRLLMSPPP